MKIARAARSQDFPKKCSMCPTATPIARLFPSRKETSKCPRCCALGDFDFFKAKGLIMVAPLSRGFHDHFIERSFHSDSCFATYGVLHAITRTPCSAQTFLRSPHQHIAARRRTNHSHLPTRPPSSLSLILVDGRVRFASPCAASVKTASSFSWGDDPSGAAAGGLLPTGGGLGGVEHRLVGAWDVTGNCDQERGSSSDEEDGDAVEREGSERGGSNSGSRYRDMYELRW